MLKCFGFGHDDLVIMTADKDKRDVNPPIIQKVGIQLN